MSRYYCSGFDYNDAFGHGLGDMFKKELKGTNSIVYIPAGVDSVEKAKNKYVPIFNEHFQRVGINFEKVSVITPELTKEQAKSLVKNADFIFLMGGDPFKEKEMCEQLEIMDALKNYQGVMLGLSAGAMLMSKYIIITPCSEEYPDFQIGEGLNLDGISVYPHNNTSLEEYPEELINDDEIYNKNDLIKVANEYGEFYLLQDYIREDGLSDVSYIKSNNGAIELCRENDGKIWIADPNINLIKENKKIR